MLQIFDPKTPVDFVGKMWLTNKLGFFLPLVSLVLLFTVGINWGIDFSGGTEMQVKFSKEVSSGEIRQVLEQIGFKKQQVQQYGAPEAHEMLIRVERITTLTEEDAAALKQLLVDNAAALSVPAGKAEEIRVDFKPDEGDRVTITLPIPAAKAPADKNADPAAVEEALKARLGEGDAKAPLDDAAIDGLSAQGFDRAAVAAKARELGYEVTARADKLAEPERNDDLERERALRAQEAALSTLIEGQSRFKLRRTKAPGAEEATTADAIMRNEPYLGQV